MVVRPQHLLLSCRLLRPPWLSQMVADPAVHGVEGWPDRRRLHAHGLGAAGLGLRHPAAAGAGVGIRGDYGVRIRLHAYPPGHIFRASGVATIASCQKEDGACRVSETARQECSTTEGFLSIGLKEVAMSLTRRGINLVQINGSILRGSYANIGDYVALTKPRVMSLVVFTALVGLMVAPGGIDPFNGVVALLCIAAGAGAAGALNMWYDADIDAMMARTAMRPIPRGRVSKGEALVFGTVLGAIAVVVLALATNLTAAALLAGTILFYVVVYTAWLKRATRQNIVIGGAAGALPPMIGWAAATGQIGLEPLMLFLIIFLWTPPHFWALALNRTDDYARAGVPMLPVVAGRAATTRQILIYSGLLVLASE